MSWKYNKEKHCEAKEDMGFREMVTNLFNTEFLEPEEIETIVKAAELYADVKLRKFKAAQQQGNERHRQSEIITGYIHKIDSLMETNRKLGEELQIAKVCWKEEMTDRMEKEAKIKQLEKDYMSVHEQLLNLNKR